LILFMLEFGADLEHAFIKILDDIHHHGIQIFQPPVYDNEDEETIAENEEILVRLVSRIQSSISA